MKFQSIVGGVGEWLRLGTTSDAYCRVTSSTNLAGFTFLHHTHIDYVPTICELFVNIALNVYA